MPKKDSPEIYIRKKRRILGELIKKAEIKSDKAFVSIHGSSKEMLLTYESEGLVAAINGSGTLGLDHQVCQEAVKLTNYVMEAGGIIINGGRNSGIMEATSRAAKDYSLGVIFPELEKKANAYGQKVIVNSPTPRNEILAICAPAIVIFRGGLGSLMMLMRAIVHIRNRVYHPEQPPQLLFVSNYWIGLLQVLFNLGCLPRDFIKEIIFFDRAEQIIAKLPKNN